MEFRKRVLEIAFEQIGKIETGNDNNDEGGWLDKVQKRFGLNSTEWCAMFDCTILEEAAAELGLKYIGPHTASSQEFFEKCEKLGATFTDPLKLQPGDSGVAKDPGRYKGHVWIHVRIVDSPKSTVGSQGTGDEGRGTEKRKDGFVETDTIEGNVPNADYGTTEQEKKQQGVWRRRRLIPAVLKKSLVKRYVRGFVNIEKLVVSQQSTVKQ